MRWEQLFADLESQARASETEQWRGEVRDRARAARAEVTFGSRLLATVGSPVTVMCSDGERISGVLLDAASQWMLVSAEGGREHVIPVAAVDMCRGLAAQAAHAGIVDRRLTFASALRGIARDRSRVQVSVRSGVVQGVLAGVGQDVCEVRSDDGELVSIPLSSIQRCTTVG
ncbi:hypothetical protein [Demequina flava]|uniref:hypothetical protein n=1 Tax=Demequina flava TaxID=1095025 RepID=UPI000B1E15F3|nr:hypothetical protein [Demequina flava]